MHRHRRRYGFARAGAAVEVVTVEVRASAGGLAPPAPRRRTAARAPAMARAIVDGRARDLPLWRFDALPARVAGPAIVLQSGATLWVAPGWAGGADRSGALVLRRSAR